MPLINWRSWIFYRCLHQLILVSTGSSVLEGNIKKSASLKRLECYLDIGETVRDNGCIISLMVPDYGVLSVTYKVNKEGSTFLRFINLLAMGGLSAVSSYHSNL
jgi:hypothetical protein